MWNSIETAHVTPSRINKVCFSLYTPDEIRKLSVKRLTNTETFDSLSHPTFGGLYDPALGPVEKEDLCGTCMQNYVHCPGHLGHIDLALTVYHPIFFKLMLQILRSSCMLCNNMAMDKHVLTLFKSQMKALDYGLVSTAAELPNIAMSTLTENASEPMIAGEAIKEALNKKLEEDLLLVDREKERDHLKGKNVVDIRHTIVKLFMKEQLGTSVNKVCKHCQAPLRQVMAEFHARVYLKSLSHKKAASWVEKVSSVAARNASMNNEPQEVIDIDDGAPSEEQLIDDNAFMQQVPKDIETITKYHTYLTPLEVKKHMIKLWENDGEFLSCFLGSYSTTNTRTKQCTADMFFVDVLPVPPSRFRPLAVLGDKKFDNPQTATLGQVLKLNRVIEICQQEMKADPNSTENQIPKEDDDERRKLAPFFVGKTPVERFHNAWLRLQTSVNRVMDSGLDKLSKDSTPGIKQIIEKKEGLFRKHMMGKRVNYAARSVISPDFNINIDEIGIPEVFAKKLTYPQPVTPWNVKELRQAVMNGPAIHPGAAFVEHEDGKMVLLNPNNPQQREAVAKRLLTPHHSPDLLNKSKKVYRHLKNGDVLLLNRQPTLHRPSIMAHKARVLPSEKTLRLHYANCKSYNADFDGDEMNAHFPQNELARSEANHIASANYQYLSPKDGMPLGGLIQDHMIGGVLMTIRGRMFTREDYQQLVFSAIGDRPEPIKLLRPCIIKPVKLWSGKQVLSTVLINVTPPGQMLINLTGKAKISVKKWVNTKRRQMSCSAEMKEGEMCESQVIIRDSELLCGVLDKAHYGATPFGLVHCCYELYGGETSGLLLSCFARVFTIYLQYHGFSLGVEDILVKSKADAKRRKIMVKGKNLGYSAACAAMGLPDESDRELVKERMREAHHGKDDLEMKELDRQFKKNTDTINDKINKTCMPLGLLKPFPKNSLQLMVESGAKGSAVNCIQISCLLGQIELEGRRPPLMPSGKSLPSFSLYDTSPRAGGFIDGRFLTGIRPQEYFFHCMAGREGLVDTAVKTSRSGYLQRCLIKHMEGIMVSYDLTVRDSDGSVIQFFYGEDGLDITKASFLLPKQFPFMIENYKALSHQLKPKATLEKLDSKSAGKTQRKVEKWMKKHPSSTTAGQQLPRVSPFLLFAKDTLQGGVDKEVKKDLNKKWHTMADSEKERYITKASHCPDPVISKLRPDSHFGSISEKLAKNLKEYVKQNPHSYLKTSEDDEDSTQLNKDKFNTLIHLKALRTLAEPGEGVGLLAAQSIGEPSTQMTLNTFHFAGRGDMNVTLGIPRLREILMTASANIKTPSMDIPLLQKPNILEEAKRLKLHFTKVTLSQVLAKVDVWESLTKKAHATRNRVYRIKFKFLPESAYKEDFCLTPGKILSCMEKRFFKRLVNTLLKAFKATKEAKLVETTEDRPVQQARNEGSDDQDDDDDNADLSDEEGGDGDAAERKGRTRREQQATYEAPDEEEEEIAAEMAGQSDEEDEQEQTESNDANVKPEPMEDVIDIDDDGEQPSLSTPKESSYTSNQRIRAMIDSDPHIYQYSYDKKNQRWCEIQLQFHVSSSKLMLTTVIEKLAKKFVVHETPGINRCFLVDGKDNEKILKTDGVNLREMWNYPDALDLNRIYTNDIHAIANTYGIEAASRVIAKEVREVFGVYGIRVDPRHLVLVADYMTYEGQIKGFNRMGIESSSSPFQKMSFETTMHFLRDATISGDVEALTSPSSRLVVGRIVETGTGAFELKQPLC